MSFTLYGEEKLGFLREPAPFEHGTPSRDTLSAVFRAPDLEGFNAAFAAWTSGLAERIGGMVVAIDGKTARGSRAGGETLIDTPEPRHLSRSTPGSRAGIFAAGHA